MSQAMSLLIAVAAAAVACGSSGCANLLMARSLQSFADSLAEGDLPSLKEKTSSAFESKALRSPEALEDFKYLNLPKGKVSVTEVEEISDVEKRITVEVGERKKKLDFKLTREPGSRHWVVDDIYQTQKKKGLDETITKSVTEQMDLLLTVREFLDNWRTGGREDVLAITTPPFRELLADLSPTHLQQLTTQVVGKESLRGKFRPDARLEDERAVVILPQSAGNKLIIELTRDDDRWAVNDVAVESRDPKSQIPSTQRLARILRATGAFLTAYQSHDRQQLAQICTDSFYRHSISVGDLSTAPLPTARMMATPYELRVHDEQADLVLEAGEATYMLTLVERAPQDTSPGKGRYSVDEVTIYEAGSEQIKRLSALFTAHAMVHIFSQAFATGDLQRLQHSSTSELNQHAWQHLDDELLASLPLDEIEPVAPRVVATVFQGPMTEVTVMQGSRALTYILRESRGQIVVDDIRLPVVQRPNSLKENLRALVPIYVLARAVYTDDFAEVRRVSSQELDRLVWQPVGDVPEIAGFDLVRHLTAPVSALSLSEDRADVVLGNDTWGARVTLEHVGGRFFVDDVLLIAGPGDDQRVALKHAGRLNLAQRSTAQ